MVETGTVKQARTVVGDGSRQNGHNLKAVWEDVKQTKSPECLPRFQQNDSARAAIDTSSALWGMEEEKVWEQDTRWALFLEAFDFMFMGNPLGT